jgi:hypothetical protein
LTVNNVCPAQAYLESDHKIHKRFLALATQLSTTGRIRLYEHGHMLKEPFAYLLELKPGGGRAWLFRHKSSFFVAHAGPKKKAKVQKIDFAVAEQRRAAFFASLSE